MHTVGGGGPLPASPVSHHHVSTPSSSSSSVWRRPRSTVSSPDFSDSKDEEDMDIDPDENSPPTDSILQFSSALLRSSRCQTLTSLSNLCISEQNKKPALLKRAQSVQMSAEKVSHSSRLSLCSAYSAKQSLCLTNDSDDDADCHLSDVTQLSSQSITRKERLALTSLDEVNDNSKTDGALRFASLENGQHKPLFGPKSILLSAFVLIAVSVCFGYIQQLPAAECMNSIDIESLHHELQRRVHGQHIAVNVVVERLQEFSSASDRRLLIMSFHGWTGIGKNFMSSIIAQHLPATNVHKFIIPLHFAHDMDSNAALLSEWITSNVSYPSCGFHLFIVDEVDKAPSSLVRSLRDTLRKLSVLSDMNCRALFLLLTNDGATVINTAVTEVLVNGGSREDLELEHLMLPHLDSNWYTELMSAELIDQTVPFLPLERRHIAQCAEAELKLRQVDFSQQLIDNVVNSLLYFPPDVQLFSSSGCRRIAHLVDRFL